MRTFARKPKTTRRAAYAESREPPRVHPAQGADLSSILRLQRTIGNHNVQRLYPNDTEALNSLSVPTANTRFIQGISRMPVSSSASRIPKSMLEGSASSNALKRIQKAAQYGLSGSAKPLPHLETIQSSFGRHSLSEVKAFVAGPAGNANRRLGSTAYTTGESVAFKQSPDLRVAAHEAAHVVQQRSGMPIRDVLGNSAGRFEKEADAVANAVVHGRSAEHLLDKYSRNRASQTKLVQCDNGACVDLRSALSNSMRVIDLFEEFLAGDIEWEDVTESIRTVGIAGEGIVGSGRELPQIVQDAINEAEGWHLEDISHFGRLVIGLPSLVVGSGEYFNEQRARNEIERQNRLNLVYIRYMYENSCPDFPGQWTDFQQQILPIGTRGSEQGSTIGPRRETRTALAWITVGDEHILMLATEVAGSRSLRFVRWIDSEMRDLALRQARARQGSIPTVPRSAVTRLPSTIPSSAARR